jgi:hypothetical protein
MKKILTATPQNADKQPFKTLENGHLVTVIA